MVASVHNLKNVLSGSGRSTLQSTPFETQILTSPIYIQQKVYVRVCLLLTRITHHKNGRELDILAVDYEMYCPKYNDNRVLSHRMMI